MNEPIISPWIFYALNIVDNLKASLICISITCLLALIFTPIIWDEICTMKHIKYMCVTAFVSIMLLIFIPDSRTIIQMVIAQHVTVNNIEKASELTDHAVDKIIEKIIRISTGLNKKR